VSEQRTAVFNFVSVFRWNRRWS